jgi:putative membrane protein
VNAIVRPIAFILTLPITILTLGLFLLVLNAFMVWLVQKIVPGFHAPWFIPAFLTSLIVWLVSWVASWLIGQRGFERYARHA